MLNIGDIIVIDKGSVAKGAKVLAYISEHITDNIYAAKWIKCEVEPYLCDTDYEDTILEHRAVLATDSVLVAAGIKSLADVREEKLNDLMG
jgi:hypothetical protein